MQTPAHGKASAGAQIVSSNAVTTSAATDFYATQSNGNSNERVFEYAPNAKLSGLCITQTSPRGGLSLQRCGGRYTTAQELYALGDTQNDTSGLQWLDAATGRVIDIGKHSVTTDALASSSNNQNTYLHWVQ